VSAPHFFVERLEGNGPGHSVVLGRSDSRHALRSLRLRPGEEVTVADGRGLVARGALRGEQDGLAVVEVVDLARFDRPSPPVEVAMAPPKGDRLWWAAQKLGEIGADRLSLLKTERTVRSQRGGSSDRTVERLASIAREAAMQSRRPFVMEIGGTEGLAAPLTALLAAGRAVLLHGGADRPLREVLHDHPPQAGVVLLVGPEGGFSDQEVGQAVAAGAAVAALGPGILRTETAAVVGATLALARYGRLG